jgi:hypothetical protein
MYDFAMLVSEITSHDTDLQWSGLVNLILYFQIISTALSSAPRHLDHFVQRISSPLIQTGRIASPAL